jgi:hypothetical protein
VRIGLIGDTHGYVPALEAAIVGCRDAGVDVIVHCGDFLSTPFSPDPPDENIALLRASGARVVYGNGEIYLARWNTPMWDDTLAQRRRRPDSPDHFLPFVAEGQAALSRDSLAWLRSLPGELVLDAARDGDVYVCHSMPGDPFNGIWDVSRIDDDGAMRPDPAYTPAWEPGEISRALRGAGVSDADLILCGHVPYPLVLRTPLSNGRFALVVRGVGFMRGEPDGRGWMVDYWILENAGPPSLGYAAWELRREVRPFRPREPGWRNVEPPS